MPEQPEPEASEAPRDRFTYKLRNATVTSKPILLWAVIVGLVSFAVATGPSLTLTVLGITQKQLDANPDLEGALGWATLILSIALPVVGGWRATVREGSWIQGGMTGFWSNVVFTICLIIYSLIAAAVLHELGQINGSFFISLFLEYIVFQGLLGFGLGAMGGWYSTWQRRRAQQAREVAAASS
jgi:hypothetical protein